VNLGVVPLLSGDSGGVYQYSLMMLDALRVPGVVAAGDRVTMFVHDPDDTTVTRVADPAWAVQPLGPPTVRAWARKWLDGHWLGRSALEAFRRLRGPLAETPVGDERIRTNPVQGAWFRRFGVDLMLYPVPMTISFECGVPYIFVVHDLQHRLQPHFPEVGEPAEWRAREYLFRNGVHRAEIVIADSEVGCADVLACYGDGGLDSDRVRPLPFVPPAYLPERIDDAMRREIRRRYALPARYFFYPAQFWPHKNHVRLIEALALLRARHGITAPLVLCGSNLNEIRSQTFSAVNERIERLALSDSVRYIGFVPDGDIAALFAEARALVMPTFFGPTNIPILEAWSLGCPVLTSDLRGIREQAGDAALLADPASVGSLAEGLYRLWSDDNLCQELAQRGAARLGLYGPKDFADRLADVLRLAKSRLGGAS